jgi:DNA polymerase III subunit beta
MKFSTDRESLLRALQLVTGVVERRQTLPVLSNLLVSAQDGVLSITGTDLEVEMVAQVTDGIEIVQPGEATIPARKLADIWRSLPESAVVTVEASAEKIIVRSGRSRFSLATLPAGDFPKVESSGGDLEFPVAKSALRKLIDQVSFSMAQQDVRYFLNGMLLEVTAKYTRTVATDGHRLAMCTIAGAGGGSERMQAIVPRKGVVELGRLLDDDDGDVILQLGTNHLRVTQGQFTFTTKLVDGKFPDYEKVVPKDAGQAITGDREALKQAFTRASILSNEKYRGVRLIVEGDQMTIQANNPEQEEAEEIVAVDYQGERLEIGFNVSYLQDVLSVLHTEQVQISVSDANSSALIEGMGNDDSVFVVMPMRL